VLQAAETVIEKLAQLDIGKRERKALKNSANQLRKVLSDRISSKLTIRTYATGAEAMEMASMPELQRQRTYSIKARTNH
jgi:hypothetical protein